MYPIKKQPIRLKPKRAQPEAHPPASKPNLNRRPIRVRENRWVRKTATWLIIAGLRPNHVSLLSVVFAGMVGASLILSATTNSSRTIAFYLVAILFISLRGLCNLWDGLMAVEGGLKTKSGEIFNEMPDRISDLLIFVPAGYSLISQSWGPSLGWLAGLLAVLTAYVRALGASAGAAQYFCGPMARHHRMWVMAVACLATAVEAAMDWNPRAIAAGLLIIIVGCVITILRRISRIVSELESK